MKKRPLVFDFDGVLVDTYEYSRNICTKLGIGVSHEEFKAHHDGNVFEKPKINFTPEIANEFYEQYFENIHGVKPFLTLDEVKKLYENYDLFIISSNSEKAIEKFLSHHELDYFKEVLGAHFHKSKVDKFKYIIEKYSLNPEEIIFVTDTLGDILEGNKVGVKTIAVDYGYHEKERLMKGNPYKIISSFENIIIELIR